MDPSLSGQEKFISTREAALLFGYTNDYVSKLAREGKVIAQKVGKTWFVNEGSLQNFAIETNVKEEKRLLKLKEERTIEYKSNAYKTSTPSVPRVIISPVKKISKLRAQVFVVILGFFVFTSTLLTGFEVYELSDNLFPSGTVHGAKSSSTISKEISGTDSNFSFSAPVTPSLVRAVQERAHDTVRAVSVPVPENIESVYDVRTPKTILTLRDLHIAFLDAPILIYLSSVELVNRYIESIITFSQSINKISVLVDQHITSAMAFQDRFVDHVTDLWIDRALIRDELVLDISSAPSKFFRHAAAFLLNIRNDYEPKVVFASAYIAKELHSTFSRTGHSFLNNAVSVIDTFNQAPSLLASAIGAFTFSPYVTKTSTIEYSDSFTWFEQLQYGFRSLFGQNPPPEEQMPDQGVSRSTATTTIVERIVDRTPTTVVNNITEAITVSGISSDELTTRLQELENALRSEIYLYSARADRGISGNYRAIGLTNVINNLDGVTIRNATIIGGSISGTSGIGGGGASDLDDLSDVTIASPVNGQVLLYDGSAWNNVATSSLGITGSGSSFGQVFEISGGYLAPTTTQTILLSGGFVSQASSTVSSLSVTNGTTTNATTTTLAITSIASSLLKTAANGVVSAAIAGVDYVTDAFREWTLSTNTFGQSALAPTTTQNIAVSGVGTSTFAGGLEAWRQIGAPYFNATSTTATSTFAGGLTISGGLSLFNTYGNSWDDFCTSITGGSGLCDGTDNTGGGSGLATSTDIVDTYVIYGTSASDVGAEAAFTYDDATDRLTVVNASTTNLSVSYASSTQAFFGSLSVGSLTGILRATAGVVATATIDLVNDVGSSILAVANGGTGWAELQANTLLLGNGTSRVATTSAGTNGQVLSLVSGVPSWVSTTTFSGGLTYSGGNVTADLGTSISAAEIADGDHGDFTYTGGSATIDADAVALGTDTTGNYVATLADSGAGTLTISGSGSENAAVTAALNLGNANTWTALQQFTRASSTQLSAYTAYFGGTATSTFSSTGALTLASALGVSSGGTGSTSPAGFLYGPNDGTLQGTTTISANFIDSAIARVANLVTTLDGLSDVVITSPGFGALLSYQGGSWIDVATSTLGINFSDVVGTASDAQVDNNLTISGGTIENTPIGAATPSTGVFTNATSTNATTTTLYVSGALTNTEVQANTAARHNAVTLSGAFDYITLVGQDIVRAAIDLATDVTGILAVANGGTGWANLQANTLLLGNGTSRVATTSAGTNGQVLSLVSGVPSWVATTTFNTPLNYAAGAVTLDTSGTWSGTASLASALVANGANCSAGNSPLGVDASGAVEGCFDVWTEAENTSAAYTPQSRSLTIAGTANQITSSAGAQDLSGDRTWTLSIPSLFSIQLASTTGLSALGNLYAGNGTATTTIIGNATSTFGAGVEATYLNITGTAATSTFARGIDLAGGCFAINGTCVGGGSGSPSGSDGQLQYNNGGSFGGASSVYYDDVNNLLGIGSTSPWAKLAVNPVAGDTNQFVVGSSTATSFIINSAGHVGVGSESAAYPLEVTSSASGLFSRFYNTATNGQGLLIRAGETNADDRAFQVASRDDTKILTVYSSGKVGIGTTTPWAKLAVNPVADDTNQFVVGSSTATSFLINSAGSVGIGTSNPTSGKLTVNGSSSTTTPQLAINSTGAVGDSAAIIFNQRGKIGYDGLRGAVFIDDAAATKHIVFDTGGSERLRITSAGNVGVGTTTPWRKLAVTDTVANPQLALAYDTTRYATFQVTSVGDLVIEAQGDDVSLLDENLYVCTGGSCPTAPAGTGNLLVENIFVAPQGTAPTVTSAGAIAIDTSGDDMLLVADEGGTARALPLKQKIWSVTVASTSPAFISAGLLAIPVGLDGYTMTDIRCKVDSGTSKVIAIEDASANSTEDITCATTVTSDDGSITNATATAAEEMYINFGATSGAVDTVSITVYGYWTRE